MKQISANITGSFILNNVDLTTTIESSSIWSGSIASRVSSLEQFSSSLDSTYATDVQLNAVTQSVNTLSSSFLSYTSSTDDKIAQLNRETASLNLATASLYAATASLYTATASLYAATASINSYTASNSANVANLFATSASLNAAVADIRNATASLYNATSSIYNFSASILSYTASNNNNISTIYAATASLYGATSSLFTYSASATLRINALDQYTASLNTRSASFACIDSTNNFACAQYFSNTSNAVGFSSTGSLYSDGGMRITKDMYVSGTAYFNNVTVFGTQSINYITSSQLNIASNLITVNTSTPAVRFGGLAVYDSGSLGTGLTGSILWDSEANHWVYSNPSGSSYSGGMFISGPRSAALGSEQGTTACALVMGQGGDHITSSAIFHYGNATCFYGTSYISSDGAAQFNSCVSVNTNNNIGALTVNNGNIDVTSLGLAGCSGLVLSGGGYTNNIIQIGFGYINGPSNYAPATIGFKVDNGSGNTKGDLIFATRNSISDIAPTVRATIFNTGEACFGNTVCALTFNSTNLAVSNGSSNILLSSNNNEVLRIQGFCPSGMFTSFMSGSTVLGDVGNSNQAFSSGDATGFGVNARGSRVLQLGTNQAFRMTIAGTGETTFTCQVCAPSFISSGTICSTGNTCFGGMSIVNSCLGIGTASPITTLQINAVSPAIRLQETSSGGDKRLEFCVNTSGVAVIAANQSAQVLTIQTVGTERLRIDANGISCFACQICTTSAALSGNIVLNRANTSAGNNIEWRTASTLNWYIGTRGLVNNNFYIINEGLSGLSNVIINATTGVTTFACSVTANGSLTINEDGGGTKVLTVRSDWAGVDPAINVTTNNCLLLMTNNTVRLCLSNTGIATFACQVCSPQYITTQGSSVSYVDGSNYLVWSSESEYSAVDNNTTCTLTTMKTWIADRTGCVRLKFAGYISSGPTYWGWRIYRNGTSAYTCQSYATCLETGCSANVHGYTTFSVGIGPVNPGDCITLQMVSTGGGSVPAPGQGQTLYAKEFRIYSTTPNLSAGSTNNVFGDWVGIGTCIPYSNLYINGNNDAAYDATVDNGQDGCGVTLTVRNNSTVTNSFAQLNLQASGDSGRSVGRIVLIRKGSATGDMAFVTEDSNTKAEKLRITSTGNVGIGTSSPTCKLEVDGGSSAVALRISTTSPSTGTAALILANSSKSAFNDGIIMTHGGGYTNITGLTGGNIMTWDATNCRVGIGTTSPGAKLQVYGNLQIYSGTSGYSDPLVFGAETGAPKKAIFLENFWMVYQGHDNEGHKFRSVNASGVCTDDLIIYGNGVASFGSNICASSLVASNINLTGNYNNSYTICSSGWSNQYVTIIPPNTLGTRNTYVVSVYADNNGAGAPYVAGASFLFTPGNTNGSGIDNEFQPLTSMHQGYGGGYSLWVAARAGSGQVSAGLAIKLCNWATISGGLAVKASMLQPV